MTIKTNKGLAAWAVQWLGQPYWYGGCCYPCTESLLQRKAAQYPSHYKPSRMPRYRSDIAKGKSCADCVGLIKGFYWTREDGTQGYKLDGRPDTSAGGMFNAAKVKGPISTLPEIPGLLLHSPGHVGVYIGNGDAVEARGFSYGIVRTKVSERSWTHWYKCPYITYVDDAKATEPASLTGQRRLEYIPGKAMLRGADVKALQELLNRLGFDCGIADGIFGSKTSTAVKAFQRIKDLEEDGVVGSGTWAALEVAKQGMETEAPSDEPTQGQKDTDAANGAEDIAEDGSVQLDYGTRLLRYKAGTVLQQGADVMAVQVRLIQLGFDPGKADGVYGPKTAEAVKAFQQRMGITTDGIVGPVTRGLLTQ